MSAWLVSKDTIDLIVTAAISVDLIKTEEAQATGKMLWHENMKSLAARYGDPIHRKALADYIYVPVNRPGAFSPEEWAAVVVKSVSCYSYQSCEHEGWAKSKAAVLVERLAGQVASMAIRAGGAVYDSAPWGFERSKPLLGTSDQSVSFRDLIHRSPSVPIEQTWYAA